MLLHLINEDGPPRRPRGRDALRDLTDRRTVSLDLYLSRDHRVPIMNAVSWGDFCELDARLSFHVAERITGRLCYLATIRSDGHPRVHPVGLNIRGAQLIVPMSPTSPKGRDLRRSGKYAAHCAVEDNNGGQGEVLLTGMATECDAAEEFASRGWITFDLSIGEVLSVLNDGSGPVAKRWRASAS